MSAPDHADEIAGWLDSWWKQIAVDPWLPADPARMGLFVRKVYEDGYRRALRDFPYGTDPTRPDNPDDGPPGPEDPGK